MPHKRMTIDDVARLAFVSRSVVSRVLNDHPNVSDVARERVLAVVHAHRFRPHSAARRLVTARYHELGVVLPRRSDGALATGFWPLVLLGITDACAAHGYGASIATIGADDAAGAERFVRSGCFDAFVLVTPEIAALVAEPLAALDMPAVLIGHADGRHPSVDVDNAAGAHLATAHLLGLGRRRIAFVHGPAALYETAARRDGYARALAGAGLAVDEALVTSTDYALEGGYAAACAWLDAGLAFDAVFCASDVQGVGVLRALHERGVAVPEAVAVAAFDGLPMTAYTVPSLTTARQPIYEKGRRAVELALARLEAPDAPPHHEALPVELLVRESSVGRSL